tara:strand:+ start:19133 stop:19969 length:837 start_codon:yes stop_codon:yes gene_type:complete
MKKKSGRRGSLLSRFRKDPYFLLKYYGLTFTLSLVGVVALLAVRSSEFYSLDFRLWHILLIPAGLYLGVHSAVLLHNAAHYNIKPRWLNRFLGELAGFHQLYGFAAWSVAHLVHHMYPDDLERDPHPPDGMEFGPYFLQMRTMLRNCLEKNYFAQWEDTPRSRFWWKVKNAFGFFGMWTRMALWFLLLGPELFIAFYLPSYVATIVFFAHFNYFTHRTTDDGSSVILNLDHNLYYKLANRLFFGIYYHGNHHHRPSYINPMDVPTDDSRRKRGGQVTV